MGAAEREEGPKQRHPAVTAVLLLAVVGVLSLFPVALYANTMAMLDGYRASQGQAGTPGTATVEDVVEGRGGQVCMGTFVRENSPITAEVRIEVPDGCEEGQEIEVRLMEGRPSMFIGYDRSRAWAAGANDWAVYIPLVILFGLLSLPLVLLVFMILAKLSKKVLGLSDGPKV